MLDNLVPINYEVHFKAQCTYLEIMKWINIFDVLKYLIHLDKKTLV